MPAITALVAHHFQRTLVAVALARLEERGETRALKVALDAAESGRVEVAWRVVLPDAGDKAAVVRAMFDRIAPRYDRLNSVLTMRLDRGWRRATLAAAAVGPGDRVLDVACGTGDLVELALRRGARVVGVDFAAGMLAVAGRRGLRTRLVARRRARAAGARRERGRAHLRVRAAQLRRDPGLSRRGGARSPAGRPDRAARGGHAGERAAARRASRLLPPCRAPRRSPAGGADRLRLPAGVDRLPAGTGPAAARRSLPLASPTCGAACSASARCSSCGRGALPRRTMSRAARSAAAAGELFGCAVRTLEEPPDPLDFLAAVSRPAALPLAARRRRRARRGGRRDGDDRGRRCCALRRRGADAGRAADDAQRARRGSGGRLRVRRARDRAPRRWRDYPAAQLVLPQLALVRRGGRGAAGRDGARRRARRACRRGAARRADARDAAAGDRARPPRPPRQPRPRARRAFASGRWRRRRPGATRSATRSPTSRRAASTRSSWRAPIELDAGVSARSAAASRRACAPRTRAARCSRSCRAARRSSARRPSCSRASTASGSTTAAVAGSAARGERARDDRALAAALRASVKDRAEHAAVVDDLVERLRPLCRRLAVPRGAAHPRVTAVVQHLWTPLRGGCARRRAARRRRRAAPDPRHLRRAARRGAARAAGARERRARLVRRLPRLDRRRRPALRRARRRDPHARLIRGDERPAARRRGPGARLALGGRAGGDPAQAARAAARAARGVTMAGASGSSVGHRRGRGRGPARRAAAGVPAVRAGCITRRRAARAEPGALWRAAGRRAGEHRRSRRLRLAGQPLGAARVGADRARRDPLWSHVDERSAGVLRPRSRARVAPPVALVCTSGTAVANLLPAVVEAFHARVPLLLLTADRPPSCATAAPARPSTSTASSARTCAGSSISARRSPPPTALRHVRAVACRAVAVARGDIGAPAGPVHLQPAVPRAARSASVPGDVPRRSPRRWRARPRRRRVDAAAAPGAPVADGDALEEIACCCGRAAAARGVRAARRSRSGDRARRVAGAVRRARRAAARRAASNLRREPRGVVRRGRARRGGARTLAGGRRRRATCPTSSCASVRCRRRRRSRAGSPACDDVPQVVIDPAATWADPASRRDARRGAAHGGAVLEPRGAARRLARAAGDVAPRSARPWLDRWRAAGQRARRALARGARAAGAAVRRGRDGPRCLRGARRRRARARRCRPRRRSTSATASPCAPSTCSGRSARRRLRVLANRGANGIDGFVSSVLGAAAAIRDARRRPVRRPVASTTT